jgi:hypothetical protein
MIPDDPATAKNDGQLIDLEETARVQLAIYWVLLAEEPAYPVDTEAVVNLLTRAEFDVSADTLLGYLSEHVIPPVPRIGGRLSWFAVNITSAIRALNNRRRWKMFSTIHQHKLTLAEWTMWVYAARGQPGVRDLADHDFDELLGLLVRFSGDAGVVQALAEALREKLQGVDAL